jgi:hypothetical protein
VLPASGPDDPERPPRTNGSGALGGRSGDNGWKKPAYLGFVTPPPDAARPSQRHGSSPRTHRTHHDDPHRRRHDRRRQDRRPHPRSLDEASPHRRSRRWHRRLEHRGPPMPRGQLRRVVVRFCRILRPWPCSGLRESTSPYLPSGELHEEPHPHPHPLRRRNPHRLDDRRAQARTLDESAPHERPCRRGHRVVGLQHVDDPTKRYLERVNMTRRRPPRKLCNVPYRCCRGDALGMLGCRLKSR